MAAKRAPRAKSAPGATSAPTEHAFTATLARHGTLYGVDVPAAVSRSAGRAAMPVTVRVRAVPPFQATLIPCGDGRHRIYLNTQVRKAAGVGVGDPVAVAVVVDPALRTREVPLPPDLREALADEGVLEAWESLPPGKREHILKWIEQAVHEATREKRIGAAVVEAHARREKNIDRGM
jgi:hypothetical protein